ncbi:AAA-ATPase At2g18193-like [Rhododendron vialii]|uniref:AAA-ATPase At2g18193-like n=1 Tax=Rhododendron vialii TaxID=182163 RepID=UPI00265FFE92|nr:AAA-ATPase At2g18193-like [Rhododendron vialii]
MDRSISSTMNGDSNFPFATSTMFVAIATFAGTMKLIRSMTDDMLQNPARSLLESALHYFITPTWNRITPTWNQITIVVNELHDDTSRNQMYDAAEVYLRTKINPCKRFKVGPCTRRLKVGKTPHQSSLNVKVEKGQEILDKFEDMELKWRSPEPQDRNVTSSGHEENRYFELSFNTKFKVDRVLNEYLPYVLAKAKEAEGVKLYTRNCSFGNNKSGCGGGGGGRGAGWGSINLDHPATFETLEIDPKLKDAIIDDLKGFLAGKELVGKARKRCYWLYGPPGTGKSSLIAAMADYLKFDVYDLELTSLSSNSELRSSLMSTTNQSIIVIRDVDCCVGMQDRLKGTEVSLSCLLSFIDGLWLSCGNERIIVFTTNNYRLDPALSYHDLMDMHIYMSYFSSEAKVAEELRKRKNADIALSGVVNLLKRKKMEAHEIEQDRTIELQVVQKKNELKVHKVKRLKLKQMRSQGSR